MERISFNIPLWPALISGCLYAISLNGFQVPLWLILLPLLPYGIVLAALIAAGIFFLVYGFMAIIEEIKK